jgi:hypothetical protein
LSERSFDARLHARASQVFDWLSGYLDHPAEGSVTPTAAPA